MLLVVEAQRGLDDGFDEVKGHEDDALAGHHAVEPGKHSRVEPSHALVLERLHEAVRSALELRRLLDALNS